MHAVIQKNTFTWIIQFIISFIQDTGRGVGRERRAPSSAGSVPRQDGPPDVLPSASWQVGKLVMLCKTLLEYIVGQLESKLPTAVRAE